MNYSYIKLQVAGLQVQCIRTSKEEHLFDGQADAALFKTDQGTFEVWFLPDVDSFRSLPLKAGAQQVENRVEHSATFDCARSASGLCCRRKRGKHCPRCVAHVRGISVVWYFSVSLKHLTTCTVAWNLSNL